MSKIYLVLPGLNVERSVGNIIKKCKKYVKNIIFIDDGSKDKSSEVAKRAGAEVIKLPYNHGKGFALRTGFAVALAKDADIVITMDSDGQTDPKYIPQFLKAINEVDVVIGSRARDKFSTSTVNYFGNGILNMITNIFAFGPTAIFPSIGVSDTQSGYRAFTKKALEKMNLIGKRYEIEGEMIYEIGHKKLKYKEIHIKSSEIIPGVKITDGVRNGVFLLKKLFRL